MSHEGKQFKASCFNNIDVSGLLHEVETLLFLWSQKSINDSDKQAIKGHRFDSAPWSALKARDNAGFCTEQQNFFELLNQTEADEANSFDDLALFHLNNDNGAQTSQISHKSCVTMLPTVHSSEIQGRPRVANCLREDDEISIENALYALPPPLLASLRWKSNQMQRSETSLVTATNIATSASSRTSPIHSKPSCFSTGSELLEQKKQRGILDTANTKKAKKDANCCSEQKDSEVMLKGEVTEDVLLSAISMKLPESLNSVTESSIAGLESVKKAIRDKVINPILRPDLHHGLRAAPKGILLFGPPGTGKTLLAKWISQESGASFFEASPSALCSKFYGETETLIKALFKVAEAHSPSVVFIDEVDSLLSKRTENEQEHVTRMKNQLLQMMDGITTPQEKIVILVGATNRPEMLDDAALRRFSKRILVPLPNTAARMTQIKQLLEDSSTGGCAITQEELLDIANLLEGWNGSDIRNLCAKGADCPYDEAVNRFGGICNIPNSSVFRPVRATDLRKGMETVHPSCSITQMAGYSEWAALYGLYTKFCSLCSDSAMRLVYRRNVVCRNEY